MKKFRRSTKSSDKTDSVGSGRPLFVPQKDAYAIVPPKKVIRALYNYQAPPDQRQDYLSFATGDFLHVVSREDDPDWYEACNPLHNVRGLVPVNHFVEVGKQGPRESSDGMVPPTHQAPASAHDSGFSEKENVGGGIRASKLGRTVGAMVYGIVQYDFKAERADELDARAGEAIIVIAQSNSEWFVAKPIQRLGGPGLIPVSFIEIRDMTTGQPVPNPAEAVQRAGVPRVEEWKQMAAQYKNSSIPLGTLGQMGSQQSLEQDMGRMSLNSVRQSQATQNGISHNRTLSKVPSTNLNGQRWSQVPAPLRARILRYSHHNDEFWFIVEAYMDDARHWDLFRSYKDFYNLQLALKDTFPVAAGVTPGARRTLPLMPGPVPWVSEKITQERRTHLDKYLISLLRSGSEITASWPIKQFFTPRSDDAQVQDRPDSSETDYRHSGTSSQHSTNQDSHTSSAGNVSMTTTSTYNTSPSRQNPHSPYHNSSPSRSQQPPPQQQQQQQQQSQQPQNHYRQPSDLRNVNNNLGHSSATLGAHPPMLRNNSAMTSNSALSSQSQGSTAPVRVKVWFGNVSCIIIRLPQPYAFQDLLQKLKERWDAGEAGNNHVPPNTPFEIQWRDEDQGNYHPLSNDRDLQTARESCDKLTLRVQPA